MNNFFLTFLSSYITTSTACFLLDVFNPSLRLHEDTLENIVKHYKHVSNIVTTNILINALPLYLFLEIYYYGYQSERGIFVRYLQILLSLFMGLVLHLYSGKMFQANMFKKYVTNDNSIQHSFGWQTYYVHPVELYLVYLLPPIIVPFMFSFSQEIVDLLIVISNVVYVVKNSSLIYANYINYFIYDFEKFLNLNINPPVNQKFQVIDPNGDTHEESVNSEASNEASNEVSSEASNQASNEASTEASNEASTEPSTEPSSENQVKIEGTNVSENLHLD